VAARARGALPSLLPLRSAEAAVASDSESAAAADPHSRTRLLRKSAATPSGGGPELVAGPAPSASLGLAELEPSRGCVSTGSDRWLRSVGGESCGSVASSQCATRCPYAQLGCWRHRALRSAAANG
jgi:hypothetical protein